MLFVYMFWHWGFSVGTNCFSPTKNKQTVSQYIENSHFFVLCIYESHLIYIFGFLHKFHSTRLLQRFSLMTAILLPTVMCHWQLMHQCWALLCASPSLICVQIKRGALGSRSPYRKKRCTWSWKSWNWKLNSWVAIHLTKPKWSSLLRNSLVCQDFKSSSEDLSVDLDFNCFYFYPFAQGGSRKRTIKQLPGSSECHTRWMETWQHLKV